MKQVTLYVKVGRAAPQGLATFDMKDQKKAEQSCDAVQGSKTQELLASGVAFDRFSFSREVVEIADGGKSLKKGK